MTSAGCPAAVDSGDLDALFAETVRRTGASIGALYLLTPDERLLRLDVLCGAPAEFAEPWARVPVAAPAPVAVAARENRLVWVGSQEEMARSYPRTAAVLPIVARVRFVDVSIAPVKTIQRLVQDAIENTALVIEEPGEVVLRGEIPKAADQGGGN